MTDTAFVIWRGNFLNHFLWFAVSKWTTKRLVQSVQFSHSVVSDSLRLHELQHAKPPCPSPTPGVHSDSPPSSQWCHPAISSSTLLFLPPNPPSIRVFSSESTLCMRWSKYWSFSFSIIPSKEIPGLISFRMDWLDLLAVQGTLKSLVQHDSSKEINMGNGTETCKLSYMKWIASPGSMHDTGCLGLVHWDDLEGWDGERGRSGGLVFPSLPEFSTVYCGPRSQRLRHSQ